MTFVLSLNQTHAGFLCYSFVIFISNSTQKQTRNTVAFCVPRENRKNDCYLYFSKALQAIDIVTQYCAKNMTVIILPS